MCRALVSRADFEAILTPFSEGIPEIVVSLLKEGKDRPLYRSLARRHSMNRSLLKRKSPESQFNQ